MPQSYRSDRAVCEPRPLKLSGNEKTEQLRGFHGGAIAPRLRNCQGLPAGQRILVFVAELRFSLVFPHKNEVQSTGASHFADQVHVF